MVVPVLGRVRLFKCLDDNALEKSLAECLGIGYKLTYMTNIIDGKIASPADSFFWQNWFSTLSIRVDGRTAKKIPVSVYCHRDNYFSDPKNIKASIDRGLRYGAGDMPQKEFQKLLDKEDNETVFVVDKKEHPATRSVIISVDGILDDPHLVSYLGGERRAELFMQRYKQIKGEQIGIVNCDNLDDAPRANILYIGLHDLHYLRLSNPLNGFEANILGISPNQEE